MNYSTYRFTLDIHKTKSQVSIPVLFQDTGVQFYINLTDGGKPYHISDGCRAVLYGKKPLFHTDTGKYDCLLEDLEIIDGGTRIRYAFSDQTTTQLGSVACEIRLYSVDGKLLTTPAFEILVEARVVEDDQIIESADERSALDRIFESEAAREEAEERREAVVAALQEQVEEQNANIEDLEAGYDSLAEEIENARESNYNYTDQIYLDSKDYTDEMFTESKNYTDEKIASVSGQQYIDVEDSESVRIKEIPSGALPYAYIDKIGGRTEKMPGEGTAIGNYTPASGITLSNGTYSLTVAAGGSGNNIGTYKALNLDPYVTYRLNATYSIPSGCTFEPEFYLTGEDSAGVGIGEMPITKNTEFRPCDYYAVQNISVNLKSCNYSNTNTASKTIKFSFAVVPVAEKLVSAAVKSIISQGRNLVDDEAVFESLEYKRLPSGYWEGVQKASTTVWENTHLIKGAICVSYIAKILTVVLEPYSPFVLNVFYTDGSLDGYVLPTSYTDYKSVSFKTNSNKTVSRIRVHYGGNGTFEIKDLMISTEPLPYEKNATTVRPMPTAITSLDSYGCGFDKHSYNESNLEDMKYRQKVKRRVFTGSEDWKYKERMYYLTIDDKSLGYASKCSNFEYGGEVSISAAVGQFIEHFAERDIGFVSDIPTLEEWKAHLAYLYENGAPLEVVYRLESEIVTDIPKEADINPITISGGDLVIFENEGNLDMPNTITYIKKNKGGEG